jgi:hypothetical protein
VSQDEVKDFVPPEEISPEFLKKLEKELGRLNPSVIVAEEGKNSSRICILL